MRGQEEISTSNSHLVQGSIIFVMYTANSRATNKKVKNEKKKKKTKTEHKSYAEKEEKIES